PQEMTTKAVQSLPEFALNPFKAWTRRAGGRFYSHKETIEAGEYSDDTQLILCTARSLASENPMASFILQELPGFAMYERGAGRATKRAVDLWTRGRPPWRSGNEGRNIEY